ncbi:Heme-degrading monooxygenase HmoB [Neobacillus rhizosphaerae]|uniref:Heme-degrading monooxygenase HmoB n=1 Tax=Neobacillus rhizosphaerae TaxID=2880965 RepID=A0ABM9ELV2_9BACI|nr:antibiotic biosynthesis monooxygenase [Neobacillus rhizosphaerae]CAH2713549.1 Heme-degrading monooxygenase HmoB [Neobacillus rhizosphaerae]
MNVYMTAGTFDFLKRMETNYPSEAMVTMVNENGALLLHETKGKTLFKEPRRYELLEGSGEIKKEGFVVIQNIPVAEEGRPVFEHQMKNRVKKVENESGFKFFRVLRPLSSNTYVIMTVWDNELSYQKWQNSKTFFVAQQKKDFMKNQQPKIFESASYVSKYSITE